MAEDKVRRYELIYLVQPEADDEGRERVASRLQSVFEQFEVQVVKQEEWGKRKLAYEIRKFTKAYYMYVEFISSPSAITEMERVLRLLDDCVRHQTIRLEDGLTSAAVDVIMAATKGDGGDPVPEEEPAPAEAGKEEPAEAGKEEPAEAEKEATDG
jgi:small subunit ribosomal protein S6